MPRSPTNLLPRGVNSYSLEAINTAKSNSSPSPATSTENISSPTSPAASPAPFAPKSGPVGTCFLHSDPFLPHSLRSSP
ncbi:hypothetical protein Naga_101161g3 [Nannochloropsis gaditana]|uniref:Uncharacterized protein n=1 Tax=Nannochloropsis gaditana TaxID=72520 RepID=W7U6A1_9STRA|nr:hypothetical protein Naga_101161g3 [Nannochloropsis gaditana]